MPEPDTDDSEEQQEKEIELLEPDRFDRRDDLPDLYKRNTIESEDLDGPLVQVEFRWELETLESPTDCYLLRCPHCDGEKHIHSVYEHPRVAFSGISKARCVNSGEPYYLTLPYQGRGIPYEVIRYARHQLTNPSGDELLHPLLPVGVDLAVIDDLIRHWTPRE